MPTLTTLAAIKSRLNLPSSVTDQDAVLDALRGVAEERILQLTGFTFTPGQQVETQVDVRLGEGRYMKYRPIKIIDPDPQKQVTLRARAMASNTFSNIIGEVRDAYQGRVMPLASELTPIFPPIGGLAPWFRWRQMVWPVVEFTYTVDELGSATNPVPAALSQAAIEWTIAMYGRSGGGYVDEITLERVSERYNQAAMPPIVQALVLPYVRLLVALQF